MHINTIYCGRGPKLLLRTSYRDGARVRKTTLANVTHWDSENLKQLKAALQLKRDFRGTAAERSAVMQVYKLVSEHESAEPALLFQMLVPLIHRRIP